MRHIAIAALVAAATAIGACGDDETTDPAAPGASDGGCDDGHHYVVLRDPAWTFKEAVDYPAELGDLAAVQPDLDWYADHDQQMPVPGSDVVEGLSLNISSYRAGLDEHVDFYVGADLTEREISEQRALVGRGPEVEPSIVAIAVADDATLSLTSYGLDPEELVDVAAQLDHVCQDEWIAAGGEVLDCLPTEPGCVEIE